MINQISHILIALLALLLLSSCSKNQDDIDLPIYDALGGEFSLTSTQGQLTLSEHQGQVVLINFGYSSCPDVCPMILSRLDKLTQQLETQFAVKSDRVQTIFISVDPERDSIPHLKEYLNFYNPNFIGVSGTKQQTNEITKQYAVFYEKQPEDAGRYQVAHTDKVFLIDKRGRLRGLYSINENYEQLMTDIVRLVSATI